MECVGLSSAPDSDWICMICKGAKRSFIKDFDNLKLKLLSSIINNVQDCSLNKHKNRLKLDTVK